MELAILDLSGLTLQSGPSRLVKDEYTPGPVVTGGLDLDGSEIGTIQHHPHQGQPGYGFPQGYYLLKSFLKLLIFLLPMIFVHILLLGIIYDFCFNLKNFDKKLGGEASQIGNMYQGPRAIPKNEPGEQQRNPWMVMPPPTPGQNAPLMGRPLRKTPPHKILNFYTFRLYC